ncbi:MAG: hypothetical protein HQ485_16870 [Acidobacteria bacterium]|jgi:hypothetical protein|nr:hypothetical protein [Acidobacteriota bacterium]
MVRTGGFESIRTGPPEQWLVRLGTAIGTIAVTVSLVLVGLILYAVVSS